MNMHMWYRLTCNSLEVILVLQKYLMMQYHSLWYITCRGTILHCDVWCRAAVMWKKSRSYFVSAKVQITNFILSKISVARTHSLWNYKNMAGHDRLEINKTYCSASKWNVSITLPWQLKLRWHVNTSWQTTFIKNLARMNIVRSKQKRCLHQMSG